MISTTIVIATRDRRESLLRTLDELRALPERPPVIVVDNGSSDGTPGAVRARHPEVTVLGLGSNAGALARNVGVRAARTPYVAFSDDDSWWERGALRRAEAAFAADPRLGVVVARTLVGSARAEDPINFALAGTPLPDRRVLGFLACASVVRRAAFLEAGGFHPVLFFVAEETLLALDLAARGWTCRYFPGVVAVHDPSALRPPGSRRRRAELRNATLTTWLRRPLPVAAARTLALGRTAVHDPDARAALLGTVVRLPRALRHRRPVPPGVERAVRLLERR